MGSSGDRLCQTSPIPRSPDGDNNCSQRFELKLISNNKYVIFSKQTNNMEIDILKTDLYLNSPLPVRFRTNEIFNFN